MLSVFKFLIKIFHTDIHQTSQPHKCVFNIEFHDEFKQEFFVCCKSSENFFFFEKKTTTFTRLDKTSKKTQTNVGFADVWSTKKQVFSVF
jgi:hypothetical protein